MSNTPPQHLSSTIMYWVWLTPVYMTSPPKSWFWKLILIWAHVLYTGLIWFAGCSLLWQTDCSIQLIKLALWCRASLLKVWKYSIKKIDRTLPCIKLLALFHPSAAHSWLRPFHMQIVGTFVFCGFLPNTPSSSVFFSLLKLEFESSRNNRLCR